MAILQQTGWFPFGIGSGQLRLWLESHK